MNKVSWNEYCATINATVEKSLRPDQMIYKLINTKTEKTIKDNVPYNRRNQLRQLRDKLDNEYGGYVHQITMSEK